MAHNTTTTDQAAKAHTYQASPATAALLDCIIATDQLYSKIADALQLRYGAEAVDSATPPYLEAVNKLTDLLHHELQGQVIDGLMDVKNTAAQVTII